MANECQFLDQKEVSYTGRLQRGKVFGLGIIMTMIVALAAIHAGDKKNVIGKGGGPRHKT